MATHFRVHFEIATNEDLHHAFALADDTGTPVDLTAATLAMDLIGNEGTVVSLRQANGGIVITDAAQGVFEVVVPRATLAALPPRYYRHDLTFTKGSKTHRIWEGGLALVQGLTQ
jgi:hypothetical protein